MRTRDLEHFLPGAVAKGGTGAKYVIREHLGSGGCGDVFRAEEVLQTDLLGKPKRIGKELAFKVIQPDIHEPDKFRQELLISTRLNHPHIVRGFDTGRTQILKTDFLYLAMEMGQETLHKRLTPQQGRLSAPLPLGETLEVAKAIALALFYTHSLQPRIVHFDVKPSNVLRVDGVWKLADFGLARVLEGQGALLTKTTSGTDDYKAPERFLLQEETPVDTAADIWAFGTLLLACLGLLPPGAGMHRAMTCAVKQEDQPLPSNVLEPLIPILQGCLRANWRQRMTAEQILAGLGIARPRVAPAIVVQEPLPPSARRRPTGAAPAVSDRARVNSIDGAEMVFIPAGPFLMGDDDDAIKDYTTNARNNPRHTVTLSGYWIYKNVVTVKQYLKFCTATGHAKPSAPDFNANWSKGDHPIVNVSWEDAKAYCDWAGVRLPTEAEWEKAARARAGRKYPWGDKFDLSKLWCSKSKFGDAGGTTAVGKYGISPYGVTDMAGNVWQWCADWYDADFWTSRQAEEADPQNQSVGEQKFRVLRGGSWHFYNPVDFRAAFRVRDAPGFRLDVTGFRGACGL